MRANLVKVGLDELQFPGFLEKPRPELSLGHLLPQDKLNAAPGMVGLGCRLIDFLIELELDGIVAVLAPTGKAEFGGRKIQLERSLRDVRGVYRQVEDILGLVLGIGALSPEDLKNDAKTVSKYNGWMDPGWLTFGCDRCTGRHIGNWFNGGGIYY